MTGFAPSARWTWQAVEGKALSGEVVETRIASTDCGVIPAASHAHCPATTAKSDDAWPCSTQYLVRIPVERSGYLLVVYNPGGHVRTGSDNATALHGVPIHSPLETVWDDMSGDLTRCGEIIGPGPRRVNLHKPNSLLFAS